MPETDAPPRASAKSSLVNLKSVHPYTWRRLFRGWPLAPHSHLQEADTRGQEVAGGELHQVNTGRVLNPSQFEAGAEVPSWTAIAQAL